MGVFRQSIWFVGGMRLYAFICGYICVYMLDGERSYANSESRHFYTYTHARVYGIRPWRGRPHTIDIEPLSTKKGP